VTGFLYAGRQLRGGMVLAALGELISEEMRGWLDLAPHAVLRLAARRLCSKGWSTIYEDEWLPELAHILRGAEARPITRLIAGTRFSFGILISANRIAGHLRRKAPAEIPPSRHLFQGDKEPTRLIERRDPDKDDLLGLNNLNRLPGSKAASTIFRSLSQESVDMLLPSMNMQVTHQPPIAEAVPTYTTDSDGTIRLTPAALEVRRQLQHMADETRGRIFGRQ